MKFLLLIFASTCEEANRVSQEKIGYWDALSMCGPLAWTIICDANGFPYWIGSWTANACTLTATNPRWRCLVLSLRNINKADAVERFRKR